MKKLLALTLVLIPTVSLALEYKVLSVVNGESISSQQVRDRVELVMSSAGMEKTEANKKKVTAEVFDILTNEILQKQDAAEKNIKLDDRDVSSVLADLEKRNNLKAGGLKDFIKGKGLSYESVKGQIVAGLLWKRVINLYIRPSISVSDEDVKQAEKKSAATPVEKVKTMVNLSEIIIPIEFGKEQEAKDLADAVLRTARGGTEDFGELAKKYSVGKTAPKKGMVGWMPEEGMIEPLASNIKKTETGKISEPIKAESMYVILKVNDRRTDAPPQEKLSPKEKATVMKIEDAAKKYIKGLRDKAYIEKKFKDGELYGSVWG